MVTLYDKNKQNTIGNIYKKCKEAQLNETEPRFLNNKGGVVYQVITPLGAHFIVTERV